MRTNPILILLLTLLLSSCRDKPAQTEGNGELNATTPATPETAPVEPQKPIYRITPEAERFMGKWEIIGGDGVYLTIEPSLSQEGMIDIITTFKNMRSQVVTNLTWYDAEAGALTTKRRPAAKVWSVFMLSADGQRLEERSFRRGFDQAEIEHYQRRTNP